MNKDKLIQKINITIYLGNLEDEEKVQIIKDDMLAYMKESYGGGDIKVDYGYLNKF